jgi:hypothetical protein
MAGSNTHKGSAIIVTWCEGVIVRAIKPDEEAEVVAIGRALGNTTHSCGSSKTRQTAIPKKQLSG